MYIKNNFDAEYIKKVNERVSNTPAKKTNNRNLSIRTPYTHFGYKTWPEVIRLYKELKKEKIKRS